MFFTVFLIIHVLICIALVVVVLMQSSKGEGLAGAFGGGGGVSGAVFGGRGAASFLSRATTILAIAFMVSCLGLSLMSSSANQSAVTGSSSAVSEAAQRDAEAQQQAAQQQTLPVEGATDDAATAEDIFNTPPPSDSQ
ncbi:MAG: preprotein translocase subunit SecG [FCB group bacterium]|nr:preprotein translocase subunit SecG [FCB group bacterium]